MKKNELFTTAPAAKFVNRSEQTIQNWAKKGKLPFTTASTIIVTAQANPPLETDLMVGGSKIFKLLWIIPLDDVVSWCISYTV